MIEDRWLKLFTVFYQLVGIAILVEVLRRLGLAFVAVRARERDSAPPGPRGQSARPGAGPEAMS